MNKRVTIYDIAKRLNVSTGTINRALNNKSEVSESTRELVIKTAREMGFTANRTAMNLARGTIQLAFFIHNIVPVFHDEITRGVEQAFQELANFNVVGKVYAFTGSDQNVNRQMLKYMRQLGEEGYKGILLILPTDISGFREQLASLSESGTKVALVNSDMPESACVFSLRKNSTLAGRISAELLHWFTRNGNVAVFTGRSETVDHAESVAGFQDEASRRSMNLVDIYEDYEDPKIAAGNIERLLREHPETEGIYFNTANSSLACQKLIEMGMDKRIKIVASDLFTNIFQLMKDDIIHATIFQDPFYQGLTAMRQLYNCILDADSVPREIFVDPHVILKSNIDDAIWMKTYSTPFGSNCKPVRRRLSPRK